MDDGPFFFGWIVGILAFAALVVGSFSLSYSEWDHQVAYRKKHIQPGWVIHTGTVVAEKSANFADQPADVRANVQFLDYYGTQRNVYPHLPYRTQVGNTVTVGVDRHGDLWIPQSYDYNSDGLGEVWAGPKAAAAGFYPVGGILVFTFVSFFIALLIGLMATAIADGASIPKFHKGTRGITNIAMLSGLITAVIIATILVL